MTSRRRKRIIQALALAAAAVLFIASCMDGGPGTDLPTTAETEANKVKEDSKTLGEASCPTISFTAGGGRVVLAGNVLAQTATADPELVDQVQVLADRLAVAAAKLDAATELAAKNNSKEAADQLVARAQVTADMAGAVAAGNPSSELQGPMKTALAATIETQVSFELDQIVIVAQAVVKAETSTQAKVDAVNDVLAAGADRAKRAAGQAEVTTAAAVIDTALADAQKQIADALNADPAADVASIVNDFANKAKTAIVTEATNNVIDEAVAAAAKVATGNTAAAAAADDAKNAADKALQTMKSYQESVVNNDPSLFKPAAHTADATSPTVIAARMQTSNVNGTLARRSDLQIDADNLKTRAETLAGTATGYANALSDPAGTLPAPTLDEVCGTLQEVNTVAGEVETLAGEVGDWNSDHGAASTALDNAVTSLETAFATIRDDVLPYFAPPTN